MIKFNIPQNIIQGENMRAKHVVGYDISQGMLNFAQQKERKAPLGNTYISNISSD